MKVKEGKEPKENMYGYIPWTSINLKEVYINLDHVTRIWPWKKSESEPEMTKVKEDRAPAYVRGHPQTNVAASIDIPD